MADLKLLSPELKCHTVQQGQGCLWPVSSAWFSSPVSSCLLSEAYVPQPLSPGVAQHKTFNRASLLHSDGKSEKRDRMLGVLPNYIVSLLNSEDRNACCLLRSVHFLDLCAQTESKLNLSCTTGLQLSGNLVPAPPGFCSLQAYHFIP